MSDLLEICSLEAEGLFRKRGGKFPSVLFVAGGEVFEAGCYATVSEASDAAVLKTLAQETAEDFKARGITEFAVAYLIHRVTQLRNTETGAVLNMPQPGLMIEEYSVKDAPRAAFREILHLLGRPALSALSYEKPSPNSPFKNILSSAVPSHASGTTAVGTAPPAPGAS